MVHTRFAAESVPRKRYCSALQIEQPSRGRARQTLTRLLHPDAWLHARLAHHVKSSSPMHAVPARRGIDGLRSHAHIQAPGVNVVPLPPAHGTAGTSGRAPFAHPHPARLTANEQAGIWCAGGYMVRDLAAEFGVYHGTIPAVMTVGTAPQFRISVA